MKTAFSIDWIRATKPFDGVYSDDIEPAQKWFGDTKWDVCKVTMKPYTSGLEGERGSLQWNSDYAEFGLMVNISGAQCAALRERGIHPTDLIKKMKRAGFKFTRIDFAVDVLESGGRPSELYHAWRKGQVKSAARKVLIIQEATKQSQVKGETVYFGSKSSTRMVRIYDKAAERGVDKDWLRIEVQLNAGHAQMFAATIDKKGMIKTGLSYIRSAIQHTEIKWFECAVEGEGQLFNVAKLGRKETQFEKWFWSVVLPAVVKAIRIGVPGAKKALQDALGDIEQHGP